MATVDSTGRLTPRRVGNVIIEASAGGWRRATRSLSIGEARSSILFDEQWSDSLLSAWRTYGAPRPEIVSDETMGRAFWSHGDEAFYSGAYTIAGFPTGRGLWVEMKVSSPVTAAEWQIHSLSFAAVTDSVAWNAWDHVHGDAVPGVTVPHCEFGYPRGQRQTPPATMIALSTPSGGQMVTAPAGFDSGSPFDLVLQILPDGRCGFAIDGKVLWVGGASWAYQRAHVMLAGNSVDTRFLVGRLRVHSGIAPNIDWDLPVAARDTTVQ